MVSRPLASIALTKHNSAAAGTCLCDNAMNRRVGQQLSYDATHGRINKMTINLVIVHGQSMVNQLGSVSNVCSLGLVQRPTDFSSGPVILSSPGSSALRLSIR